MKLAFQLRQYTQNFLTVYEIAILIASEHTFLPEII